MGRGAKKEWILATLSTVEEDVMEREDSDSDSMERQREV
jgi:hypothetical protein